MSSVRVGLLATAVVGLLTSASYAQTVVTMDGHYYKLVPLRGALPRSAAEALTVIPSEATASVPQGAGVPQASGCRLTQFTNGEYQPEYVTLCGPP